MQNITTKIFKNPNLPYVELRFNQVIQYNPKLHIHDSLTLAALKSGALSIFPHSSQLLRNGNVALINPYHAHYGKVVEIGNDGIYVLYLDMNWCEEVQKSLFGQQHKFYPLRGGVIDDLLLYRDFFILADTLFSEVSTAIKVYAVKQFASQLFCDFCDTGNSTTETSFAYAIKIFLEQNFRKNITLEDLATRFEISPFHLLRAFKKSMVYRHMPTVSISKYIMPKVFLTATIQFWMQHCLPDFTTKATFIMLLSVSLVLVQENIKAILYKTRVLIIVYYDVFNGAKQ